MSDKKDDLKNKKINEHFFLEDEKNRGVFKIYKKINFSHMVEIYTSGTFENKEGADLEVKRLNKENKC